MRRGLAIFLLLALAAPIRAWQQGGVTAPEASFQIAGRVVDSATGVPLGKTRVQIASTEARNVVQTIITAANGRFAFAGLAAGKYMLAGERHGYPMQPFEFHLDGFSTAIAVGAGIDSSHLVFRLKPAGGIRGKVSNDFGEPERDVGVLLFYQGLLGGIQSTRMVTRTTTDDRGEYRFSYLPAGKYYIAFVGKPWYAQFAAETYLEGQGTGEGRAPAAFDVAYPLTFYPGVSQEERATPVNLKWGERMVADVQLHAGPSIHVRLRGAVQNVKVQRLLFASQEIEVPASALNSGVEEMEISGLSPGRYIVEVAGKRSGVFRSEVDWGGDTAVEVASLAAEPTLATVSGRIRFDGGLEEGRKTELRLRNVNVGKLYRASIEADGSFEFGEGVLPGIYAVGIGNAPGFFVWGLSATGANAAGSRMEIPRAQRVQLSVVATRSVGRVDGIALRDNKGMAGAMIVMVPEEAKDLSKYRRDQSDSDGTFTLRDVLPGRYTVVALEDWEVEWSDPALMKRYLPGGQSVIVTGARPMAVRVEVQK